MARICLLGVPSAAGAHGPGQEKAPGALREAGLAERLQALGMEVDDRGDLPVVPFAADPDHRSQQNAGRVLDVVRLVAEKVSLILDDAGVPLVIGGDCTIPLGVAAAYVRSATPSRESLMPLPAVRPAARAGEVRTRGGNRTPCARRRVLYRHPGIHCLSGGEGDGNRTRYGRAHNPAPRPVGSPSVDQAGLEPARSGVWDRRSAAELLIGTPRRSRTSTPGSVVRRDLRFTMGAKYPLEVPPLRPPGCHPGALLLS